MYVSLTKVGDTTFDATVSVCEGLTTTPEPDAIEGVLEATTAGVTAKAVILATARKRAEILVVRFLVRDSMSESDL